MQSDQLKRREFITLVGGAVAWPLAARAQQPAMPVIGLLDSRSAEALTDRLRGFRQGLKDTGYVEGDDVSIASTSGEIDAAFASIVRERSDAPFVGSDAFLSSRRVQFVLLTTRHAIPAAYTGREFPVAGGLMSYGSNIVDAWHQTGVYAGRILKGAKPADLPVMQASKFELVINAQAARVLGLTVPPTLLARADEVIE